ncbi:MAG: polymerase sigma factor [Mycobacterium sp.]|jgi:RNA polymerase sigma-70 factor (ECF subfamily)|nr:polymerase sigma factor [Mycobacterium sp.]
MGTTAARQDRDEFVSDAQAYRHELIAHCYRMVGSVNDAEDLVQETYLRAWRAWESFEGRSSVRTWLYRIATNLCLTSLSHHQRRVLPSGLGPGSTEPGSGFEPATAAVRWIEPFPNQRYESAASDPAELAALRSTLRLALVASLQHLPPRQRAAFILRDVLVFPAVEVAAMLQMTVPAVKSALQRARGTLEELALNSDALAEPTAADARAVLDRYIAAFEDADIAALTELLRSDARLEVVPSSTWLSGVRACIPHLAGHVLTSPGLYRMYPIIANGQPAAIAYRRPFLQQPFEPFAVVVLDADGQKLSGITVFAEPELVELFGFPASPSDVEPIPRRARRSLPLRDHGFASSR